MLMVNYWERARTQIKLGLTFMRDTRQRLKSISMYTLSDLGVSSNLIGSLSQANASLKLEVGGFCANDYEINVNKFYSCSNFGQI